MKLNLDYYETEYDNKISDTDKEIIEEYINKYDEQEFSNVISNECKLDVIYALSELRSNIINWYPFKENAKMLEIGGNFGEITGFLCDNANIVVTIEENKLKAEAISKRHKLRNNLEIIAGNIKNIKLNEKFDYIIIHDTICDMQNIVNFLKNDGKILACFDNIFGIDNFVTKYKNEVITNGVIKADLEKMIKQIGFKYSKFYYPFPDYKMTNVIFTDIQLPNEENISRHIAIFNKNQIVNSNSKEIYYNFIKTKKDALPQLANSFLLELSLEECTDNGISFVSFSNLRKKEYMIKTIIKSDSVVKSARSIESKEHIRRIQSNIEILNKLGIKNLDEYKDEIVTSKFCKEKSLDEIIINYLKSGQKEKFFELVYRWKRELEKIPVGQGQDVFEKYEINVDTEKKNKMHFLKNGLWDLIFQNCFIINNEFYFYDQEWYEENIPIEYIMYRAFIYFPGVFKYIEKNELFEKLEIAEFEQELCSLDIKIQEKIRNENIWKLHLQSVDVDTIIKKQYDDLEIIKNENKKLQDELINKEKEREDLISQLHKAQMELVFLQSSKSWKITEPLRKVNRIIKRKK